MYGQVGTRYPGCDWYWSDMFKTTDELRQDVRDDHVFNLGDPDYERADHALKLSNGDIVIVVKATDALADMGWLTALPINTGFNL